MATQLSYLPLEVREGLLTASPEVRREVVKAYRDHHDNRGRLRGEVTTPPTPGSRRYPWLPRPRPAVVVP
jgi:hypothetical protein